MKQLNNKFGKLFRNYSLSVFLIFVCLTTNIYSQASQGCSKPGRIYNPLKKGNNISRDQGLICSVSYDDPSGDNTLNENETGIVTISVKNPGYENIVVPKLKISMKPSWRSKPKTMIKWMAPIKPGATGIYRAKMKWKKKLPSGSVTYSVKAVDKETGLVSEPAELTFMIAGAGSGSTAPVFVDVDNAIPKLAVTNKYGIAVIIGNQVYPNRDVPDVQFASNDAKTMKHYLINMLGYREENIIHFTNATKADFERVFGTEKIYRGKLHKWVKPNESEVFIYYSGHGAPDLHNKKAYFMPANSDPNYVQIDGYPLDTFYRNLNKIPAKSITVVLDACFSGGSQQGMLIQNASPMYIDVELPVLGHKINLFTSATGNQIASWYPEGKHSIFTYFYLRALRGEADKNSDRKITMKEIKSFLNEHVPYMARRLYGREQTPVVHGDANRVICTY